MNFNLLLKQKRLELQPRLNSEEPPSSCVAFIDTISSNESSRFGGKAINLARLLHAGIDVPSGFGISSDCFTRFMQHTSQFQKMLCELESSNDLEKMSKLVSDIEESAKEYQMPEHIEEKVSAAFERLEEIVGERSGYYAVRSSANIEDSMELSFAGQAKSYLGVSGIKNIIEAVKKTWLSVFSLSSIMYLQRKRIPLERVRMGIIIQEMIQSEISGVMFTANVMNGKKDQIVIESTWGLGESLMSGKITPDLYIIEKNSLKIIERNLGSKEIIYELDPSKADNLVFRKTPPEKYSLFTLNDNDVLSVAKSGIKIEKLLVDPQDIEWCYKDDRLIILQARPITTLNIICNRDFT
jgi:pyruvate,water dikinase